MARPNSEKYAEMFHKCTTNKEKAIKSIKVQEMDTIAAMKIVLTLWDETSMTSSLAASESKDFVFYYVDEVLAPALTGHDPSKQAAIDKILDKLVVNISWEENDKLARNVNWAVSVAVCKAGAHCKKISAYKYIARLGVDLHKKTQYDVDPDFLSSFVSPTPYLNVTLGGLHLEKRLADQHLVISHLNPRSFNDATRVIQKVYEEYSKVRYGESGIDDGDEVSYTPSINKIKNCLRSLETIIENLGLRDEVSTGVNIGASKFYQHDKKNYRLNFGEENSESLVEMSAEALYKAYMSFWREFPRLEVFEDMFHMDDKEYASKLTRGVVTQFVITEFDRDDYDEAMDKRVCNCLHLKVGEVGSVTKCIEYVVDAKSAGRRSVVLSSHNSCATSESFLADFCIGLSLDRMKIELSCFTSDCNICNRVRELEVERAEEDWRRCPISLSEHRVKTVLAWIRNEAPPALCIDADMLERDKKDHFKERGLQGYID